ncbi:MAG TPA: C45 family peptidase [Sphingobacteriaceae bacterium]
MKKLLFTSAILWFCSLTATPQAMSQREVPVIELSGTPYERGLQHGRQLKKEIAEVYGKWKESIRKETGISADSVIADFLATTNFTPAIKKWTPDVLDEVRGIADGSGQNYHDVFAFQLIDEYWGYLDRKKYAGGMEHCSAMGVAGNSKRPGYVAQNIDLDTWMHGYQVLLHIKGSRSVPEQYHMSCAGSLGLAGMNGNRIGVVVNALTDLQASVDGLPVAYIIRGMVGRKNGNEALSFLKSVKHASGQNYIIGVRDSVFDFEASANQVVRFTPTGNAEVVYHTNHALVNHDVKPWFKQYHDRILAGKAVKNSTLTRYDAVAQMYSSADDPSVGLAKVTLRSKGSDRYPVCITYDAAKGAFTFSSVVFELGENPSVEVTFGSPDESDYQKHVFKSK